jgi:hypothetical protein
MIGFACGGSRIPNAIANSATLQDQVVNSRRAGTQLFKESEYELRPLITKDVRLRLYGNHRLARAELLSNGQPPLYYLAADRRSAAYITLVFCRDARGKLGIIR